MSESLRVLLGSLALALGFLSYLPYIRDTMRGSTRPHAISWFIWSLLAGIGFAAQISEGNGIGSWVTGLISGECLFIFLLSLRVGEREITRSDWICLIAGLAAIPLWIAAKTPLYSVILATIIDIFAFAPTFRKSFVRPHEETLVTYVAAVAIWTLSWIALDKPTLSAVLVPATALLTNGSFIGLVLVRRRALASRVVN